MLFSELTVVNGMVRTKDVDVQIGVQQQILELKKKAKEAIERDDVVMVRLLEKKIKELQADYSKDDASDQWKVKIDHLKEYITSYPTDPGNNKRRAEIKELEDKIKGSKDFDQNEVRHTL